MDWRERSVRQGFLMLPQEEIGSDKALRHFRLWYPDKQQAIDLDWKNHPSEASQNAWQVLKEILPSPFCSLHLALRCSGTLLC
jgi:hypothetical protein